MSEKIITLRLCDTNPHAFNHEKLRIARELKKIPQKYVADKLGLSQQAYRKIESGITTISLNRFDYIAEIIGIDPRVVQIIDKIPLKLGNTPEALEDINTFLLAFGNQRKQYETREQELIQENEYWKKRFLETIDELHKKDLQ
jgi:transcriptional regulator with XRE-family HTH domain